MPNQLKGTITFTDGSPVRIALPIKVYHNYLLNGAKTEKEIATGTTNTKGEYNISYNPEVTGTHVSIKVLKPTANSLLAGSEIIFNAKASAQLDVKLSAAVAAALGTNEVSSLRTAIVPHVGVNHLTAYPEKELPFLAQVSGLPLDRLRMLSFADRYAVANAGPTGDMLYAIYRAGFPLPLREWLGKKASTWTKALNEAVSSGIIAPYNNAMLVSLADRIAKDIMAGPVDPQGKLLNSRLRASGIAIPDCEKVLSNYLRFEGTDEDFWNNKAMSTAIGAVLFNDAKFAIQAANLVRGYLPLVTRLCSQRKTNAIVNLSSLVNRDVNTWFTEIKAAMTSSPAAPLPEGLKGVKPDEKAKSFAEELVTALEAAFPNAKLIQLINAFPTLFPQKADMSTFLTANPNFDLSSNSFDSYTAANSNTLAGVRDIAKLKSDMAILQRQFRLGPEGYEVRAVHLLRSQSLHSSFAVSFTGNQKMNSASKGLGYNGLGNAIYENAYKVLSRAEAIRNKTFISKTEPAVIQAPDYMEKMDSTWKNRIASMPELFGSSDFCQCDHCRSVYGPAAYLADIAQFLQRKIDETTGLNAWDTLLKRRPDLEYILLNCQNAMTSMPYIDLVIELLEQEWSKVANNENWPALNDAVRESKFSRQTKKKEKELLVMQEHINQNAWDKLSSEFFPWTLPFSLWETEGEAWLNETGKSRSDVRDLVSMNGEFTYLEETSVRDILARLKMLPVEAAAITLSAIPSENISVPALQKVWGMSNLATINKLEVFLKQSGLTYEELMNYLKSPFLNPKGDIQPDNTCNIADAQLLNVSATSTTWLQNFQGFVRLHRRLGWTINELDWALESFGYTNATSQKIDLSLLWKISISVRIKDATGLSIVESLALVGTIPSVDLRDESSLYTKIFKNHSAYGALLPKENLSVSITVGSELDNLAKALDLSLEEKNAWLQTAEVSKSLDLNGLTRFYRMVTFCRLLKVTPVQFLKLQTWIAESPFNSTNTSIKVSHTIVMLEKSRQLLDLPFEFKDLEELLSDFNGYTYSDTFAKMHDLIKEILKDAQGGTVLERKVEELLKSSYQLTEVVANYLIRNLIVPQVSGNNNRLLRVLVSSPEDENHKRATAFVLDKIVLLIRAWKFNDSDTIRFLKHVQANATISWAYVPFDGTIFTSGSIISRTEKLRLLGSWIQFIPFVNKPGANVFDLIDKSSSANDWKDLTVFDKQIDAAFSSFAGLFTYQQGAKLSELLLWMSQWKISFFMIAKLQNGFQIKESVDEVMKSVKSSMGTELWQDVAKKLRNKLREKQVDALADYLYGAALAKPELMEFYGSKTKLYEHILVDPEMSSCMKSSRIRLAHSTVQLYVQRCMMNLEKNMQVKDTAAWESWMWRKSYRLWEANRKVFLYPENWIEPELRDDKSPQFQVLEQALNQGEISDVYLSEVVGEYLNGMNELNNLEIICIARDLLSDSKDFYLCAQSRTKPGKIFYLPYKDLKWGHWTEIPVNKTSDHFIATIHDGRLIAIWPGIDYSEPTEEGAGKVNINYHIAVLRNNKWKEYSTISVSELAYEFYVPEKFTFVIKPSVNTDLLAIVCFENTPAPNNLDHINRSNIAATFVHKDTLLEIDNHDEGIRRWSYDKDFSRSVRYRHLTGQKILLNHNEEIAGNGIQLVSETSTLLKKMPYAMYRYNYILPSIRYRTTQQSQNSNAYDAWGMDIYNDPFVFQTLDAALLFEPSNYRSYEMDLKRDVKRIDFNIYSRLIVAFERHGLNGLYQSLKNKENNPQLLQIFRQELDTTSEWINDYGTIDGTVITRESLEHTVPCDYFSFDNSQLQSSYNWELFFHIPFLIACHLTRNQKFAEAQRWYHYIFDPTSTETGGPERFWNVKPFRDLYSGTAGTPLPLKSLEELLFVDNEAARTRLQSEITEWENDPFNPHLIARLRNTAYMRTIVMHYVDNLLEWADNLFRQDTMESIDEASQLYLLANSILGLRPVKLPGKAPADVRLHELLNKADSFANAWMTLEDNTRSRRRNNFWRGGYMNQLYPIDVNKQITIWDKINLKGQNRTLPHSPKVVQTLTKSLYFCIPENVNLLDYWDKVEDRMWKIRSCRNIDGQIRNLSLYEPPIDPALLVKARAMGLSMNDVISDLYSNPFGHYRFQFLLSKAIEFSNEVKNYGMSLLGAIEKRDSEYLQMMRVRQDSDLLAKSRDILVSKIEESVHSLESFERSLQSAESRLLFYKGLKKISAGESSALSMGNAAYALNQYIAGYELIKSMLYLIPDVEIGIPGAVIFGGTNRGNSAGAYADSLRMISSSYTHQSSLSSTLASYERRWEEWKQQEKQAVIEIEGLKKQLLATQIRVTIAEKELLVFDQQIENSAEQLEFMQSRFTNEALYNWMVGQLKTWYFQSYKMAYEMARSAEKAFYKEFDIESPTESYIKYGNWNNLYQGLLSGEGLTSDLRRLENAYLKQNIRRMEITRTVSLAMLFPEAIMNFKENKKCTFNIPALLFRNDFPVLKNRKIKSVSLTIPAVTGPYSQVNAVLRLKTSGTPSSVMVASHAQNDSGMFTLNFQDERYLPFEGTSLENDTEWELSLPSVIPSFDYRNISDAILTINYTAQEGNTLAAPLKNDLVNTTGALPMLGLSLKTDFSYVWQELLRTTTAKTSFKLENFGEWIPSQLKGLPFGSATIVILPSNNESIPATVPVLKAGHSLAGNNLQAINGILYKNEEGKNVGYLYKIESGISWKPSGDLIFEVESVSKEWYDMIVILKPKI